MTEETLKKGRELSEELKNVRERLCGLKEGGFLYIADHECRSYEFYDPLSNDMVTPAIKGLIIENYEKRLAELEKEFSELN